MSELTITPAVAKNITVKNLNKNSSVNLKSDIFSKLCSLDGVAGDLTAHDIEKAGTLKGKYGIKDVTTQNSKTTITCANGDTFEFEIREFTNNEKVDFLINATKNHNTYSVERDDSDGNYIYITFKRPVKAGDVRKAFNIREGAMYASNSDPSHVLYGTVDMSQKSAYSYNERQVDDFDNIDFEQGEKIRVYLGDVNPEYLNREYKEDATRNSEIKASKAGRQFAKDAMGYTTEKDFSRMKETLKDIETNYTPQDTALFMKNYYEEQRWIEFGSGFFEQLAHEDDDSKITNKEASMVMKKLMDAVPEDKKGSEDYERLQMVYSAYNSLDGNNLFKEKDSLWSRMWGTASLDNLDDAIERLFDL